MVNWIYLKIVYSLVLEFCLVIIIAIFLKLRLFVLQFRLNEVGNLFFTLLKIYFFFVNFSKFEIHNVKRALSL